MSFVPLVIAGAGAASAFCIASALVPGRNPLAERIARMSAGAQNGGDAMIERSTSAAARDRAGKLQSRLLEGGWYRVTPAAYAARCMAGVICGLTVGIILFASIPIKPLAFVAGISIALIGLRIPKIALDRAIATRKNAIERALPDFLDLLAAMVQAGLALNAALISAAEATIGPLKEELDSALAEIRLGRARSDALEAMAERTNEPQLQVMVAALIQAELLGSNVSAVLHELALDTRNRRWTLAEERASKLPVTMLLPMTFLMFPSLYIMIFGPVAANLIASGLGAPHK